MMTDSSSICISDDDGNEDDDNNNNKNNNISEQCFGKISMCSCNYTTLQYFCVLGIISFYKSVLRTSVIV